MVAGLVDAGGKSWGLVAASSRASKPPHCQLTATIDALTGSKRRLAATHNSRCKYYALRLTRYSLVQVVKFKDLCICKVQKDYSVDLDQIPTESKNFLLEKFQSYPKNHCFSLPTLQGWNDHFGYNPLHGSNEWMDSHYGPWINKE